MIKNESPPHFEGRSFASIDITTFVDLFVLCKMMANSRFCCQHVIIEFSQCPFLFVNKMKQVTKLKIHLAVLLIGRIAWIL